GQFNRMLERLFGDAADHAQGVADDIHDANRTPASGMGDLADGLNDAMVQVGGYAVDPLVLDLNGNGIELTALEGSHAYFDLRGTGFATRTGWVTGGDGILVHDINANGRID